MVTGDIFASEIHSLHAFLSTDTLGRVHGHVSRLENAAADLTDRV